MYHTKFCHTTGNMDDIEFDSGDSDLESSVATVRTCWFVTVYSGEPLASLVKQDSDTHHTRTTYHEGSREEDLSICCCCRQHSTLVVLYKDPNISWCESYIQVDNINIDETPG